MSGLIISEIQDRQWPEVWAMLEPVFCAGETYPFARDISGAEAKEIWVDTPMRTYVAMQGKTVLGTFYIKPNQPALGAHICNCGYVVDVAARGKGVAGSMCEFSQTEALRLGFLAMQFNLVVETNTGALALWQRLGFGIVGTVPKAFRHPTKGLVAAHVMHKDLTLANSGNAGKPV